MTIHQAVKAALSDVQLPVTADFNGGGEKRYITWTLSTDYGVVYGDNRPLENIASIVIHLFLPASEAYSGVRRQVRQALVDSEMFTWPTVGMFIEPDEKTRHITFECDVENNDDI